MRPEITCSGTFLKRSSAVEKRKETKRTKGICTERQKEIEEARETPSSSFFFSLCGSPLSLFFFPLGCCVFFFLISSLRSSCVRTTLFVHIRGEGEGRGSAARSASTHTKDSAWTRLGERERKSAREGEKGVCVCGCCPPRASPSLVSLWSGAEGQRGRGESLSPVSPSLSLARSLWGGGRGSWCCAWLAVGYDHTWLKAPHPVRFVKLSSHRLN